MRGKDGEGGEKGGVWQVGNPFGYNSGGIFLVFMRWKIVHHNHRTYKHMNNAASGTLLFIRKVEQSCARLRIDRTALI